MASKQLYIPPGAYFPHDEDEYDKNRRVYFNRHKTLVPRTFISDQMRAERASELRRSGGGIIPNDFNVSQPNFDLNMRSHMKERRGAFIPPPRNARRIENSEANLKTMKARHRRDVEVAEKVCHDAGVKMGEQYGAPEGRSTANESVELKLKEQGSRRGEVTVKEKSIRDQRSDVERQDVDAEDNSRHGGWSKRPFSDSKTCNIFFDWFGLIACFYPGMLLVIAFFISTLYLATHPAGAMEVMTVSFPRSTISVTARC
jgi:hypothetical protein